MIGQLFRGMKVFFKLKLETNAVLVAVVIVVVVGAAAAAAGVSAAGDFHIAFD